MLQLKGLVKRYGSSPVFAGVNLELKAGEFVAYFCHNSESIFWTEGYKSKASAKNAIDSILKNGPGAKVVDKTDA